MSELAFDINGDAFDVPASVVAWRVRCLKPRGAPEIVYERNGGGPLTVPVESGHEDLREAVTRSGKHRLDPIDAAGKLVENVPAAYIYVNKGERNADLSAERAPEMRGDSAFAGLGQAIVEAVKLNSEALRQNAEIAMRAVDRMPQLMEAMTTALNVASGTGLHALQQREFVPANDIDEETENERAAVAAPAIPGMPAGIDINAIIAQSVSQVTVALINRFMPSSVGEVVDLRKAHAAGQKERQAKQHAAPAQAPAVTAPTPPIATTSTSTQAMGQPANAITTTPRTSNAATSASTSAAVAPASHANVSAGGLPTDPKDLLHLLAIQQALGPTERALVTAMAEELTPEQRAAWLGELKALSVPEAVHKIRTTLAKLAQTAPPAPTDEPTQMTSSTDGGVS